MSSPASIGKHPIHPMLVAFPIGLLVFSLICDLVFVFGAGPDIWSQVALYTMGGGIIGALVAAVPGFIDFLSIDEGEMKGLAWKHMLVNLAAVAIFIVDFALRVETSVGRALPVILSACGVILFGVGGWLGGEMVYAKGMAVDPVEAMGKKIARLEGKGQSKVA